MLFLYKSIFLTSSVLFSTHLQMLNTSLNVVKMPTPPSLLSSKPIDLLVLQAI
jgi:hypothetical protein